ncbi:MAG: ribonuclease R [Deltaproteobacteria bacterium]|nr:ribonuclease R [Deltaproteobacteria bacterium]
MKQARGRARHAREHGGDRRRDAAGARDEAAAVAAIERGLGVMAAPPGGEALAALAAEHGLRAGTVSVHPDGYAFLVEPGGDERRGEDLYIGGAGLRPAMHGDTVLAAVRHARRGRFTRSEGRVVFVVTRRWQRLLGVCRRGRSGAYLIPQDHRLLYGCRLVETAGARDGDMVSAVVTQYPGPHHDLEARVEAVLGPASDPRVETEAVIRRLELPTEFPPDVLAEAARIPAAIDPAVLGALAGELPPPVTARRPWHEAVTIRERLDLRALPLVTIDGETARDFDDAVAVLPGPHGGARLLVAIADVAAYVRRGSALDREARLRGTSVYFPDHVLPMLPEALSNGICSLNPGVDRLVQAVLLDCDARGEVLGAAFFPGVMRSRARLTYTTVRRVIVDQHPPTRQEHADLVEHLERMAALAERLTAMRRRRGSIDLDLPEAEVIIDATGRPENIVRAERNAAHRLIESFMLAANEAVAHYLTTRRIPLPYRIHEPPAEDALRDLARFLEGFGLRLVLQEGAVRPRAVQRVLDGAAGRPEERLVHTIVLRSMTQARYAPENAGHFGLAASHYTHFTSPIRRYPDLVLHRILAAHLRGDGRVLAAIAGELGPICEESSKRERLAMDAERAVIQLKKVQFMEDKVGETYDGFVSGVAAFGLFVELAEYFVDGLVHVATLTDDHYDLVERQHRLVGRRRGRTFRVGDAVTVRVAAVSIERKQIDLVLAEARRDDVARRAARVTSTRDRARSGPGTRRDAPRSPRRCP